MQTGRTRTIGRGMMVLLAVAFGALPVWAGPKWKNLGDFTADGQAKEIAVGSVIINTLWVREGAAKTEYTVGKRMNKGDATHFIKLNGKRMVTGFRLSDGARGRYRVSVK